MRQPGNLLMVTLSLVAGILVSACVLLAAKCNVPQKLDRWLSETLR